MTLPWQTFALLMVIVVISHLLEGITGFGSTALSMPFMSMLVPVYLAKPFLTIYTLLLCAYILIRHHRHIRWAAFKKMAFWLLLGLPVGMAAYAYLPQRLFMWCLAVFTIVVAVRGLGISLKLLRPQKELPAAAEKTLLLLGGILHGAFAFGGPVIVICTTRTIQDKDQFRATMCLVWLMLNSILLLQMGVMGQLTADVFGLCLKGLPFLIASTLLADAVQKKVKAAVFTGITFSMLLLSGLAIVWTQLQAML